MAIAESFLPEFDNEIASTRRLLERVPAAKVSYRPHPKSWTLGELSLHLANLLSWTAITLQQTEFDTNPSGGAPRRSQFQSVEHTLKVFDQNGKAARAAIAGASDTEMMVPWTLKNAGLPVLTLPRVVCLRSFIMNHMIHHRGQLTVYLRICEVPLPSVYGPTADTV